MPSRPLTIQLLVVVEVLKVFLQDRVQQRRRFLSRSLTFQFLVAIFKVSSQAKVQLPHPHLLSLRGVFRTFHHGKKVRSAGQVSADLPRHVSSWTPPAYEQPSGFHEEQLAMENEEDEGDASAAGADALPPRYLGTVYRVHVAGGDITGDNGRMFTFRSSRLELAVGYRVSFFVRGSAAHGLPCFSRSTRNLGFLLGDDFWIYFRLQRFLVRHWILVSSSPRRLLYSDPAIDSRPALFFPCTAHCLV